MKPMFQYRRSITFAHWWYNVGTGWPRTKWLDFLWDTVGGGGYFRHRNNWLWSLYWYTWNTQFLNETSIALEADPNEPTNFVQTEESKKGLFAPHPVYWYQKLLMRIIPR